MYNVLALASCTQAETVARQADDACCVQDLTLFVACAILFMHALTNLATPIRSSCHINACKWFASDSQWLDSLPKEVREQKLLEVMDLMADGTIKAPPPSERLLLILQTTNGLLLLSLLLHHMLPQS